MEIDLSRDAVKSPTSVTKNIAKPSFKSDLSKKTTAIKDINVSSDNEPVENLTIKKIIGSVRVDIEKCENSMTEIFGPEDTKLNLSLFTEYEIKEALQKFNQVSFNSPQMGDLMEYLSSNTIDSNSDLIGEIANIRPCRMFQKINFLDELRRVLTSTENNEFKKEIINELTKYFQREVENSSSVANLTMALNMMEAFSSEKKLNVDEKYSKEVDSLIDQIEEDYENVLIAAEDSLEAKNNDGEGEISREIIRREVSLNKKYKKKILDLIKANL
jgi:hypothetical protein